MFEIVARETAARTLFDIVMTNSETEEQTVIIGGLGDRRDAGIIAGQIFATWVTAVHAESKSTEQAFAQLRVAFAKKPS
jgi:hypothetical protein